MDFSISQQQRNIFDLNLDDEIFAPINLKDLSKAISHKNLNHKNSLRCKSCKMHESPFFLKQCRPFYRDLTKKKLLKSAVK